MKIRKSIRNGSLVLLIVFMAIGSMAQNETIRIEAENFENLGDYTIENKAGASEFKVIRAASEDAFSAATTQFAHPSGIYTLNVAYLDEGDGAATYKVLVNGTIVTSWIGDQVPKDDEFVVRNIPGVSILTGQTIELQSNRESGEWGRIDYIDFDLEVSDNGSSFIFESEDLQFADMAVSSEIADYTGTGYLQASADGGSMDFELANDSASSFNVKIRYLLGGSEPVSATLSTGTETIPLVFIPTSQFANWQEQVLTLALPEGNNSMSVQMEAGASLLSIDRLLIQRTNPDLILPMKVTKTLPHNKIVLDDAFTLMWMGTENTQSYKVYFSPDGTFDESDLVGETTTTIFQMDKQDDATYQWRIDAVNAAGTTEGTSSTIIFKANPSVFYVATDGNNSNPGTIDEPLQTIVKALSMVLAGDTVYIRGGTYNFIRNVDINNLGTAEKMITVKAYPGEKVIFKNSSNSGRGIEIGGNYIHLKGISVTEAGDNGIFIDGSNNIIEECKAYKNGDSGIQLTGGASDNIVLNCDSYLNYDEENKGENADGYAAKFDLGPGNKFIGCRAWGNSDDGWDFWQAQYTIVLDHCWAFANGYNIWGVSGFNGDGNGFKLGGDYYQGPHHVVRCMAFDNRGKGFDQNHNMAGQEVIQCTSYNNQVANFRLGENPSLGNHRLVNNLSFDGSISIASSSEEITNSWNSLSITADDFASLDSAGVRGPRDEFGALPDLYFLKLSTGSQAVDAGTDIGEEYTGTAPDLGAYEGAYEKQVDAVEDLANSFMKCYPNPVHSTLTIELNQKLGRNCSLEIRNLAGENVLTRNNIAWKTSVDVSQYQAGLYLILLKSDTNMIMHKISIK